MLKLTFKAVAAAVVFLMGLGASAQTKNAPSVTTFTDNRDNKTYKSVAIGTQLWMAENLNYAADGSKCYNNDEAYCMKYGRLYNWNTAKAACPVGWHLPTDAEWTTLMAYVGDSTTAGKKLKSTSGWNGKKGNGTNEYGFSALPGGVGYSGDRFSNVVSLGFWWSATEHDAGYARYRGMYCNKTRVGWYGTDKTDVFSVRCVQD